MFKVNITLKKDENSNLYFTNVATGLGIEKRFYSDFGLYVAGSVDVNGYFSLIHQIKSEEEIIPSMYRETSIKPALKIGYLLSPYWSIEGSIGYVKPLKQSINRKNITLKRDDIMTGYISIHRSFRF